MSKINLDINYDDLKFKDIFKLAFLNIDSLSSDFYKGYSIKNISNKYNLSKSFCSKLYNQSKDIIDKHRNVDISNIVIDYNLGLTIDCLSNQYQLDKDFIGYIIKDEIVNNMIKDKLEGYKKYNKKYSMDNFVLINDLYNLGKTESYIQKKYDISGWYCYMAIVEGLPGNNIINSLEDIYIYQHIFSEAYDLGVIDNNALRRLFTLDKEEVESLKVEAKGMDSFVSNKLYQIYNMPSLMYDFNFSDEEIKYQAMDFINRRYSEELIKIKNNNGSIDEINNLREVYYKTKKENYK